MPVEQVRQMWDSLAALVVAAVALDQITLEVPEHPGKATQVEPAIHPVPDKAAAVAAQMPREETRPAPSPVVVALDCRPALPEAL